MLNEPVLNYDFPLAKAAAEGGWQQASRYSIWVGRQASDALPHEVIERRPGGAMRLPLRARLMHLIPAGTPFRVTHLFAPYRSSDADMVYIRAAMEDGIYHTLLAASGREVKEDRVIWFCPRCGHRLEEAAFATRRHGLVAFWPFMLEQIRGFNAAPERQMCGACGERHPACYGFDVAQDLADEAVARDAW